MDVWLINSLPCGILHEYSASAARELGSWEPSFDEYLWKQKKELHLFVQKTDQTDAEGISRMEPQMISVLEWKMVKKIKYTPQ